MIFAVPCYLCTILCIAYALFICSIVYGLLNSSINFHLSDLVCRLLITCFFVVFTEIYRFAIYLIIFVNTAQLTTNKCPQLREMYFVKFINTAQYVLHCIEQLNLQLFILTKLKKNLVIELSTN